MPGLGTAFVSYSITEGQYTVVTSAGDDVVIQAGSTLSLYDGMYSYTARLTGNLNSPTIPTHVAWNLGDSGPTLVGAVNENGDFSIETTVHTVRLFGEDSDPLNLDPDAFNEDVTFTGTLTLDLVQWEYYSGSS